MFSLVIPVYKNEENLPSLLPAMQQLWQQFGQDLEVIFVVDGSPDRCLQLLREQLPAVPFPTQLISLSRNFGSFPAITAGLQHARGEYLGVMAADLQEPPELMLEFHRVMARDEADVVFGHRTRRSDPWLAQVFSEMFWSIYRRFILPDMPRGGIDIFGCTRSVRDKLLSLVEADTNLVALLFWLGFRRKYIPYERRVRTHGKSAWTVGKKLTYAVNSIFNFTDLPIRLLLGAGVIGTVSALIASAVVLIAKLLGKIEVSGYTPIMLLIAFFGGLTALGLGIVGQYLWLTLRNARRRPNFIVQSAEQFHQQRQDSATN